MLCNRCLCTVITLHPRLRCHILFPINILSHIRLRHYFCIHLTAGHLVRIVILLMTIVKSLDYAIHVNCIKNMQWKLKTEIHVLNLFVNLTIDVYSVPIVTMKNVINGKNAYPGIIAKSPKHNFNLF